MHKLCLIFFLVFWGLFAFFSQAEEAEDGPDMRSMVFIDAKAIENKSDNPEANFKGLIDRLNNGLTECGIYRVINSSDLSAGAADDDMFKVVADDGGNESKVQTPAMKIYMTVMQYGFAKAMNQDMYGNASATYQAKIELILKIVDMRTKETLKSKNISRTATGTATTQANLVEQVLQEVNKIVVNDIIDELIKITPFSVLDFENGEAVIDVPANLLVKGQELPVFKKGKKIKNKRTGKVTARESQVATISVVLIGEDSVTCKLKSGEITPDETAEEGAEYDMYIVRIPDENAEPDPAQAPATMQQPANQNVAPF